MEATITNAYLKIRTRLKVGAEQLLNLIMELNYRKGPALAQLVKGFECEIKEGLGRVAMLSQGQCKTGYCG